MKHPLNFTSDLMGGHDKYLRFSSFVCDNLVLDAKILSDNFCRSLHRCLTPQQVEQIVNIAITIVNITIVNITINIVNISIIFAENR